MSSPARPSALSALISIALTSIAVTWPTAARSTSASANPWLARRVLNMAHQGGEIEAPSNTLFAFKTALQKGADVIELDVHATADRHLVVLHDATVDRTTDGSGRVDEKTLAQVKELDAAHWFAPDCGTCHGKTDQEYTYRGYATGQRPISGELEQAGFGPDDFRIPTLREVLQTFPTTLINIEIKATDPETEGYEKLLADLLAEFNRRTNTIVVSFFDHAIERFKVYAPDVHTGTATAETAAFWASAQGPLPGAPNPRHQALQVPITFNGITIVTPEFVTRAHANGLAVHVWTVNSREEMEWLISIGVDGIMTDRPTLLEQVLSPLDPVVAAAGDIACATSTPGDTTCHHGATSDLLVGAGLTAVLPLGDLQYSNGELDNFNAYYDPTWGRVKNISYPVPGNHEYNTPGATGYYTYWQDRPFTASPGYYSFDLGGWHLIALNSTCSEVGGCGVGSPQERWLRSDLAAHPAACTLAYWHDPRFSSGSNHGSDSTYDAFWQALYEHDAEVVLAGHEHVYERFAPQSPSGAADPAQGIRQFTVGTGGRSHYEFNQHPLPTSEVRHAGTFGVLTLTLHSGSYDWVFVPEAGGIFTDTGSDRCH
jgi:glycerophosphoryl diester phosphodiesterase